MSKQELKALSPDQLTAKADDLRRELFSLRLRAATTPVKDYTQYKKLRREIARTLTYLRQKNSSKELI
jgi:large subunit ribosomal protein L29